MPCQRNTQSGLGKPRGHNPLRKIVVTSKSPVGDVSVVTLIRTDTTLDHSQKAEKVCPKQCGAAHAATHVLNIFSATMVPRGSCVGRGARGVVRAAASANADQIIGTARPLVLYEVGAAGGLWSRVQNAKTTLAC